jgi:hypothetical protein
MLTRFSKQSLDEETPKLLFLEVYVYASTGSPEYPAYLHNDLHSVLQCLPRIFLNKPTPANSLLRVDMGLVRNICGKEVSK